MTVSNAHQAARWLHFLSDGQMLRSCSTQRGYCIHRVEGQSLKCISGWGCNCTFCTHAPNKGRGYDPFPGSTAGKKRTHRSRGNLSSMATEINDFLLSAPKPSRIAFGSCTERRMFPVYTTPTRFGIEQGLRGEPHRGPGCYDPDPVSFKTITELNSQS